MNWGIVGAAVCAIFGVVFLVIAALRYLFGCCCPSFRSVEVELPEKAAFV